MSWDAHRLSWDISVFSQQCLQTSQDMAMYGCVELQIRGASQQRWYLLSALFSITIFCNIDILNIVLLFSVRNYILEAHFLWCLTSIVLSLTSFWSTSWDKQNPNIIGWWHILSDIWYLEEPSKYPTLFGFLGALGGTPSGSNTTVNEIQSILFEGCWNAAYSI